MWKNLIVFVSFFIFSVPVFSQAINKTQYTAIDPFDYKLYEYTNRFGENITRRVGVAQKFQSVVQYVSQNKSKYVFSSLDNHTTLELEPAPGINSPSPGQTVTVYYTVKRLNRNDVEDERILDAWEDNRNKDEKGIGVEKSRILPPPKEFKRDDYNEVSFAEYLIEAQDIQDEDGVAGSRKYVLTELLLLSQDGIIFKFSTPDDPKLASFFGKVTRRYDYEKFKVGQKMKVYFLATKNVLDYKRLDDIVVMN